MEYPCGENYSREIRPTFPGVGRYRNILDFLSPTDFHAIVLNNKKES
jgi:hypothetical protein